MSRRNIIISTLTLCFIGLLTAGHFALKRYAAKRVNDAIQALDPESQALAIKFDSADYSLLRRSIILKNVNIITDKGMESSTASVEFRDCREFKFSLPVDCTVIFNEPKFSFTNTNPQLLKDIMSGDKEFSDLSKEEESMLLLSMLKDGLNKENIKFNVKKITTRTTYSEAKNHRLTFNLDVEEDNSLAQKFAIDVSGVSAEKLSRFSNIAKQIQNAPEAQQLQQAMGSLMEIVGIITDLQVHGVELKATTQPEWFKVLVATASRFSLLKTGEIPNMEMSANEQYAQAIEAIRTTANSMGSHQAEREAVIAYIENPKSFEFSFKPESPIRIGAMIQQKMMGVSAQASTETQVKTSDFKLILNDYEIGLSKI